MMMADGYAATETRYADGIPPATEGHQAQTRKPQGNSHGGNCPAPGPTQPQKNDCEKEDKPAGDGVTQRRKIAVLPSASVLRASESPRSYSSSCS